MEQRKFRIGELAQHLDIEKFVVRFWEKEFNLKSHRSDGGQRFYESKDVEKFKKIKHLLYNQGFTINGAKKALKQKTITTVLPTTKINNDVQDKRYQELVKKCSELKQQLLKFKEALE